MDQAHAFISYVRENSEVVDDLAKDLRACGVKVWLDRNDIMPGQRWKDAISNAIQRGAFFIACFSKELNQRRESYMHGELRLAIDRLRSMPSDRVWFISVFLNKTEIPSLNISDHGTLRDINAVALYEDWGEGITRIIRAMQAGAQSDQAPPPDPLRLVLPSQISSRSRAVGGPIRRVVVLMMENHSFDRVLGWMKSHYPSIEGVDPDNPGTNSDFPDPAVTVFQAETRNRNIGNDPGHDLDNVLGQLLIFP